MAFDSATAVDNASIATQRSQPKRLDGGISFEQLLNGMSEQGKIAKLRNGAAVPGFGDIRFVGTAVSPQGPLSADAMDAVGKIARPSASTVTVSNGAELAKALASAVPGQHIVLKDGTYATAGGFTVKASGSAGAPVVIEAEHALGARITGSLTLAGHDQIASGLYLDGANVAINGDRSRLTGAKITGTDGIAVLIGKGADVRVDHCELTGMDGRGISIKPDPANPGALVRPRIDHNWLHDFVGPQGENVHEPIQIGQTRSQSNISVQAVVEDNLLERVNVDNEAISIKSSDNIVRNNTLRDSVAFICNRHGERNEISGNLLDNTRGIVVLDRGTVVSNNKVVNSPGYGIKVMAGTHGADSTDQGYPAAVDTVLSNNQVDKVVIGYAWKGSTVPAVGTVVRGSQGGRVVLTKLAKDTVERSASGKPIVTATALTRADVGPFAGRINLRGRAAAGGEVSLEERSNDLATGLIRGAHAYKAVERLSA